MDYSCSLIREDIHTVEDLGHFALMLQQFNEVGLKGPGLTSEAKVRAYVHEGDPSIASPWKDFLIKAFEIDGNQLTSQNPSALVFVEVENRLFVIPFGNGRYAIPEDLIEEDFGVTCVLNTATGKKLTHLAIVTPGAKKKVTSVSRNYEGEINELVVGNSSELLSEASANIIDGDHNRKITGRQSLRLSGVSSIAQIVDDCKDALKWFQQDSPKDEEVAGLNHLLPIREEGAKARLTRMLCEQLVEVDNADISIEDIEDGDEVLVKREINIGRGKFQVVPSFSMSWFRTWWRESRWDESDMVAYRVRLSYENGESRDAKLLTFISAVLLVGTIAYILNRGKWYKTSKNHVDTIRKIISGIAIIPNGLLDDFDGKVHRVYQDGPKRWVQSEAEYNSVVSSSKGYTNCDIPQFRYKGETEVCDILTPDVYLIHVKRGTGFDTSNYVFGQIYASTQRLCTDDDYQRFISDIASYVKFIGTPNWDRRKITYIAALISPSKVDPSDLSFNSRQALARLAENMKTLGIKLAFYWIPDVT